MIHYSSFTFSPPHHRRYIQNQIANVESDKKIVEQVDHDLRSELNLVNTLTGPKQLGSLTETFLQDRAVSYDIRKELGEGGEVVDFWCQSFGYQCYEVPTTTWDAFPHVIHNYSILHKHPYKVYIPPLS